MAGRGRGMLIAHGGWVELRPPISIGYMQHIFSIWRTTVSAQVTPSRESEHDDSRLIAHRKFTDGVLSDSDRDSVLIAYDGCLRAIIAY